MTGFEPATSWSQTRRSSQAELHPAKGGGVYVRRGRPSTSGFTWNHCDSSGATHYSQHTLEVVVRAEVDDDLSGLFAAQFDLDWDTQQVSQLALQ